eukprot:1159582-Pelagomonas_calceolata.AAC.1
MPNSVSILAVALQFMFMIHRLQHAGNFKQAWETIPWEALWQHLRCISMSTSLLSVIQDVYAVADDEYALKDGAKRARVYPTRGVKQGCSLYPLLFHFTSTMLTQLLRAVTGTEDVRVTHTLYADDITLLSNEAGAKQTISDTLAQNDSFTFLVMTFYRTLNMAKSAANAPPAVLTSA